MLIGENGADHLYVSARTVSGQFAAIVFMGGRDPRVVPWK